MSRRNSRENKAARRKVRLEKPLTEPQGLRIGVCTSCGKYTHTYEPLRYCGRCLEAYR